MRINGQVPPSNPFHIARAYGAEAPAAPSAAARPGQATGAETTARAGRAQRPATVARLVAGVAPGGIDFSAPAPVPGPAAAESFAMYRHPADRNAAATAVSLGRALDINA